ncbi:MAG: hypothetical protein K2Q01_10110 [Rickettsiales bacterium]|nr:hypothetical protein [Rickettsiales bacterium]
MATHDITQLYAQASANRLGGLDYAGEVSPEEAFAFVQANPALVVDVRTAPEWQFVGMPDLSSTKAKLALVSWRMYPDFSLNPRFAEDVVAAGALVDMPIFFLCRSGGRSLDAAAAMTAAGYSYCFNISGGFEGDPDGLAHRGSKDGWKARQLPWKQS